MYLKSIKSHGFKSFADVTELELKKGITGVVGPNGSGKSNIVDAIRWVLGEQSIKALRATNTMSDVIFAGSKSRLPMSRAYVTLTFDNHDHYLNTDFETVEVKRVLYKNGENEYFINNNKVRLKDITDLFIDSGAGKESFNIISQGAVADIINSKPEDRRVIFESAAGVLKYKKRKEETNRKLLKVQDNLEKIALIINELETNRNSLEKQAEVAKKYLASKNTLENLEIALVSEEITTLNARYTTLKEEVKNLTEEITQTEAANTTDSSKVEELKLESLKVEEQINTLNAQILDLTSELADLNSEKQLTIERQKYEVDNSLIENNIIALKEEELTLEKNIAAWQKDIAILREKLHKEEQTLSEYAEENTRLNMEITKANNDLSLKAKEKLSVHNQIEILEENIAQDEKMPYAVKAILNNPRLDDIHGPIAKLLTVEDKYALAIDTALGYSANIIVTTNETAAKEAINYLKNNKLGRATFFPLNIIKGKKIDEATLVKIKSFKGFIDIASNLIKSEEKYSQIMANQLGNVLVVDNLDSLNSLGNLIDYRYRIVSLDGEILHTGGALTGGSSKNNSSVIMLQEKKHKLEKQEADLTNEIADLNTLNAQLIKDKSDCQSKLNDSSALVIDLKETINRKEISLKDLEESYKTKKRELEGTQNVKENKLDTKLNTILETFYQKTQDKELKEKDLHNLQAQKNDLSLEIAEIEKNTQKQNSLYNEKSRDLKNKEIELGKLDVRLDNLLNILTETYNMTYDKARANYKLDIDLMDAREQVSKLKREIQQFGEVNTLAIEEFQKVDERYSFLTNQKRDLENSIASLNDIIIQMDSIMKERFTNTFHSIEKEFAEVFKKLFKGGKGELKLTDPDDILQTGIDIIAEPPGKKLNSIALLSGGEKTLTAISLLFAILNVNPVPFVILDEVEAALDDANVEMFGKYLLEKKDRSQFIIITHKKKTMEYADVLYGITMQESGISKLVSVKLENL